MNTTPVNAQPVRATEEALAFARATIGDNSALEHYAEIGSLEDRLSALGETLTGEDQAERCRDLIADAHAKWTSVEEERKDAQKPHEDKVTAIRTAYRPIAERAESVKERAKVPLNAWLDAERIRLDAEARERERRAQEAEDAALAAAQEASRSGGFGDEGQEADDLAKDAAEAAVHAEHARRIADGGPKVASATGIARAAGQRITWGAKVVNAEAMVKALAKNPDVQAAALKVAAAQMRATKGTAAIAGVEAVMNRSV